MLATYAPPGLHDYVMEQVLPRFLRSGERAIDLGAGTGAFAMRLRQAGWDVLAADIYVDGYKADVPVVQVDLNRPDFALQLGLRAFGLVTAVEVIEHVESPIGFLRNVGRLLKPGGVAVLTTPNVDSAPARIKFLLTGTLRMMDAKSEKTHITPVFWDLLVRQYLSRAEVKLLDHHVYPLRGYNLTRAGLAQAMQLLSLLMGGHCLQGDNHVLILAADPNRSLPTVAADWREASVAVPR
jgi:SAM-dependent methyltransferase